MFGGWNRKPVGPFASNQGSMKGSIKHFIEDRSGTGIDTFVFRLVARIDLRRALVKADMIMFP